MSEIGNNNWALSYFNGYKYYFKILAYDDNKVLVASNLWQSDNNDTHFGHSVIMITRQNTRPEWFDECISEEEYLETYSEEFIIFSILFRYPSGWRFFYHVISFFRITCPLQYKNVRMAEMLF